MYNSSILCQMYVMQYAICVYMCQNLHLNVNVLTLNKGYCN